MQLQRYHPRTGHAGGKQSAAVVAFTADSLCLNSLALQLGNYHGEAYAHVYGTPGFGEVEIEFVSAADSDTLRLSPRPAGRCSICVRGAFDWLGIGPEHHGRYPARPRVDGNGVRIDLNGKRIEKQRTP